MLSRREIVAGLDATVTARVSVLPSNIQRGP